jgi:hypothetical protein
MYPLMLSAGPVLPETQVLNLLGHLPHLQSPLGELLLNVKHLHFSEQLVNLCRHQLVLLIKSMEVVDFHHVSPVVLGEHVESLTEHSECGGRPRKHREEPRQESPGHLISPPSVDQGVEVNNDWKVIRGVPLSVPSHSPLVHALDPPGWASVSVMAGDLNPDLSSVLDVSIWRGREWLLRDWGCPCCSCRSPFSCVLLFKEEMLHVVKIALPLHGEDQAVDELA